MEEREGETGRVGGERDGYGTSHRVFGSPFIIFGLSFVKELSPTWTLPSWLDP